MKTIGMLKVVLIILYGLFIIYNYNYGFLSIIAIFMHELAHIFFLKINGIPIKDFKYFMLGFKMKLDIKLSNNKLLILYLIGSVCNIILAFISIFIQSFTSVSFLSNFIIVNFVIGLLNLVPVFPLDGSSVLRNILSRFLKYKYVQFISIGISFLIFGLFFVYSNFLNKGMYLNVTYIVIFIFIFVSTIRECIYFRNSVSLEKVLQIDYRDGSYGISFISVNSCISDVIRLYIHDGIGVFYIIDEKLRVLDVIYIRDILRYYSLYRDDLLENIYNK